MKDENPQLLSRDDLMKPLARRYKTVGPLPVRGGYCRLQSLSEREASAYEAASYDRGTLVRARMEDANRRYLAMCLVDQAGNRLLGPGDAAKLADWDRADMVFLYSEAVAHVNAKRPALEDVEKNSEKTPAAG
ncbi:MAG: hypothetical protein ABSG68_26835 [Thermoguttaceae bacterium]|jgi:hypothetical protein